MASVFFVTPCLISWFGLPPSIIHSTTVPFSSLTSKWNHEWGLIISHFVSVPRNLNGLLISNSAEKAWCANTGRAARSRPTPTLATARLDGILSPLYFGGFFFAGSLAAPVFSRAWAGG